MTSSLVSQCSPWSEVDKVTSNLLISQCLPFLVLEEADGMGLNGAMGQNALAKPLMLNQMPRDIWTGTVQIQHLRNDEASNWLEIINDYYAWFVHVFVHAAQNTALTQHWWTSKYCTSHNYYHYHYRSIAIHYSRRHYSTVFVHLHFVRTYMAAIAMHNETIMSLYIYMYTQICVYIYISQII